MNITQTTLPWGNSTGIRLPKKALKAVKWQSKQEVNIKIEGDRIILEPTTKQGYKKMTLEEMVAGITPDNLHSEVDWGDPVGKEIW
jgi:antitoxin MazE